ncbi:MULTISPECIES: sulfurtransferase TusA family protein [unclassified Gluconobacter]|uniref:sulfurtransferase TusA family protein n=1 Tax=unclassified Gluconobacter TaxID=2644261 RepID=UPI001C04F496|nr:MULTISPECIES: sulfurtransferase TusA family protein [unclassified Gluconobacter]
MTKYETFLLDVSNKICPMTTVHVRARLDTMTSGQKIKVIVKGEEPRNNVTASVLSLGHKIIGNLPHQENPDLYCLLILKA